jgi:rRNA maturation protein Nop10
VEAAGADQYKQLQAFISAPHIEQCENNLRDACKAAKFEFDEATRLLSDARTSLANIWIAEGSVGANALTWARARTHIEPEELRQAERQLTSAITATDSAKTSLDVLDAHEAKLRSTQNDLRMAEAKLADALAKEREQSPSLIQLLQDTQTFLVEREQLEECPLCGQATSAEHLRARVTAQLTAMKEIDALTQQRVRLSQQAQREEAVIEAKRVEVIGAVQTLATALGTFDGDWQVDAQRLQTTDTGAVLPALREWVQKALIAKDTLAADRVQINNALGSFNALKQAVKTIDEKTDAAKHLQRVATRLNGVLQVVEAERKAYCDEVLRQIGDTVNALYARIHPDEPLGDYRIRMKQNVKASLESDARFGDDVGLPAGAYYSEAHLDTLGLCVYMALAKHSADPNYIIVLDDVLTSVDDVHLQRVVELIHEEAAHFGQLIITTHFRPWRDRYRLGQFETGQVKLIELAEWSKQHGIRSRETKLFPEELRWYLESVDFDRQIVASKAGILLEFLLDTLALRYRCRLPRNATSEYTLGELLGGFSKDLKKAMKAEQFDKASVMITMDIGPLLEKLQALTWIRNQVGAHFNAGGLQISDVDVKRFAQSALELANMLICARCGAIPSKNKSGSFFECGCTENKHRLYPVIAPS